MAFKKSKQRDMIMDYMESVMGHVSAEEIFEGVNKDEKKISLATVYRNLGILEEMHQIRKVALMDEGFVYDRTATPHYHFQCDHCHKLFDLDIPYNEDLSSMASKESIVGSVTSHEMTFHGICRNCKKS